MTYFLIAIGALMLSGLFGYLGDKFKSVEFLIPIGIVGIIISIMVGLIMIPLMIPDKTEITEITADVRLIYDPHQVIIDLTTCDDWSYSDLKSFSSHKAVELIDSTTKIYLIKEKSFYGLDIHSRLGWSNSGEDVMLFK